MSAKLAVTALVPVLASVAVVGNLVGKVFEDSKVDYKDIGSVVGALGEIGSFINLQFGAAFAESLELDVAEHAVVVAAFKAKFNIADDVKEGAVEEIVDAALLLLVAIAKVRTAGSVLLPVLV